MTGIVIKDPSASYRDSALGWVGCPVDATGLEFAHFFGGTLARCLKNYAPGKADSMVTGVPTIGTHSITTRGALNYLTTTMADTPSKTLIAVYERIDEVDAMIIANTVDTATATGRKTSLFNSAGAIDNNVALSALHASDTVNTVVTVGAGIGLNTPVCHSLRFDSVEQVLYTSNLSTGATANAAVGGARTAGSALRIGHSYVANGYTGQTKIYAAMGFSRKLGDAELNTVYQYLKTYCARRAIAV